jgi:uncharacterized membrane protein (UPF0127 family)
MRLLTVRNKTRGRVLGERVHLADTFMTRLRGLAGTTRLPRGAGLLLSPCHTVHTVGCIYPLDVLFIDRRGSVVAVYPNLRPMRVTRWINVAEYALELPSGTIASTGTQVRDRLAWVPSPGPLVETDGQRPDISREGLPPMHHEHPPASPSWNDVRSNGRFS